jgi:hypothetical protein
MTYGSLFPNGPSIFLRSCPLSRFWGLGFRVSAHLLEIVPAVEIQGPVFEISTSRRRVQLFFHYSRKSDDDRVPLPRVVSHLLADDGDRPVVFAVAALLRYELHTLRTAPHKVCKNWNMFRCPIRYLRFPRIAKSPLRCCSRTCGGSFDPRICL